jgi:succinate-semialdehyde dehydrogenase/glutarate-semialdehyde dehydrogenase
MAMTAVNPATGATINEYEEMTPEDVSRAVADAHNAFLSWRRTDFAERATLMKAAARVLREKTNEYAILMANEMGKPVVQGRAEVDKCAWVCEYYAENAEAFLQPEPVETEASKSFVTFSPLGVVLAVMPWNFPLWQVFRFAAPALMAGNTGVLKHASNVPGCALAIEDVFRKAGFPKDVFRTLLVGSKQVDAVIENRHVKAVARKSGEMLKKSVLELGGSDPYLILADADLDAAVSTCVASRMLNSGQSCINAKRFLVVDPLRETFEQLFVERMQAMIVGDPLAEETEVGPQAREDLRDELHTQVLGSITKGARCLLGGEVPDGPGVYYPPTVLADVTRGMPAYEEELFGPVAAIIPVQNESEAIEIANDSCFGLGAAVFTRDLAKGERIAARELDAGACFVNSFVKSDPRLPFGGIKESGYGRELSHYGIREFVNIKTVYVA